MCRFIPGRAGRETARSGLPGPSHGVTALHGSRLARHRAGAGGSGQFISSAASPPAPGRARPCGGRRPGRLVGCGAGPAGRARCVLDVDRAGGLGARRVQPRTRAGGRAHSLVLAPGRRSLGHGHRAARARHLVRRLRPRRVDRPVDRRTLRPGGRRRGGRRRRPRAAHRGRRRRAPGREDVDGSGRRGGRPRPGGRRPGHPARVMAGGVRNPGAGGRGAARRRLGDPGHGAAADTGGSAAAGRERGARAALGRPDGGALPARPDACGRLADDADRSRAHGLGDAGRRDRGGSVRPRSSSRCERGRRPAACWWAAGWRLSASCRGGSRRGRSRPRSRSAWGWPWRSRRSPRRPSKTDRPRRCTAPGRSPCGTPESCWGSWC